MPHQTCYNVFGRRYNLKNLKALRESKKLSQQALGDVIGVTQQAIYKYENCLAEPDIHTLVALADFFETSVDYLIGNSENPLKYEPRMSYDLNENEQQYINDYRQLPPSVRLIINAYMKEYIRK